MFHRLLSIAALAAVLPAQQTKVLPKGMGFVEGPSVFINPFNNTTGGIQLLIDASNFQPGVQVILGMRFRPTQQTQTSPSFVKPYQVTAYTVATTAAAFEASASPYDPNTVIGGATGTVVFNGPLTLPATSPLTLTPAPFSIYFPFSTPLLYDTAAGNLLLQVDTTDLTPVPATCRIDAVQFRETTVTGIVAPIDSSNCTVGGVSLQSATNAASAVIGGSIQTQLTASPANSLAAAFSVLAFDRADTDLAFLGMPGCIARINGTFFEQIVLAGVSGFAPIVWPIPLDPNLIGAAVVAQTVGLAPSGLLSDSVISNAEAILVGDSGLPVPTMMAGFRTVTSSQDAWFHGTVGEFTPVVQFEGVFP